MKFAGFLLLATAATLTAQEVPKDSQMATAANAKQKYVLAALENPADAVPGAFNMDNCRSEIFEGEKPPGHDVAILLAADAVPPGGKGDYHVAKNLQDGSHWIGAWFYLGPEANVKKIGIQFSEKSGEYMAAFWPADFTGWKWLESDLSDSDHIQQVHPQPDGDGILQPEDVQGISVIWFSASGGPTQLGITGLVSAGE